MDFNGSCRKYARVSRPAQRSLTLRPACSPSHLCDLLHQRLRRLRFLHRRSDCFRVERTQFPGGTFTRSRPAPFHGARVTASFRQLSRTALRWKCDWKYHLCHDSPLHGVAGYISAACANLTRPCMSVSALYSSRFPNNAATAPRAERFATASGKANECSLDA